MDNLVLIGYKKDTFVTEVQHGPFNALSRLLYKPNKTMKKIFSKEELNCLKPFDLYDKYEMDIEDVSGWDDEIFLNGKKERAFFQRCLQKVYENLENFLEEEIDFYKENLSKLIEKLTGLTEEIDFVTFYNL